MMIDSLSYENWLIWIGQVMMIYKDLQRINP